MRRREGFMQVHVQHVEAHVPWPSLAEDRVQVCPVVVQEAPRLVDRIRKGANIALEDPTGAGVRHHEPRGLGAKGQLQVLKVNIAGGVDLHFPHTVATHNGRRRIGTVGRHGHDDFLALVISPGLVVSPNHRDPGKFALGPSHGGEGHPFHARDFSQQALEIVKYAQKALGQGFRSQGMAVQETRQAGCAMRAPGVVLHGARPEGVELPVNRKIATGKAREMTHHLKLGDLRKSRGRRTQ